MMNIHRLKDCFRNVVLVLITCIVLAVSFFLGRCSSGSRGGEVLHGGTTVTVPPVSVDTVYVPQPCDTVFVPVPGRVDTSRVINDYYLQKIYRDTVFVAVNTGAGRDSARAIVTDTIYQNGIAGREVNFTFYPKRLVRDNSVGLLSTFGYHNLTIMAEYRYRMMKMYVGYNLIDHAPVAGVGFQIFSW